MFLGSVGFFEESKRPFYFFFGCMVGTKIIVGSPVIMAETSFDVINMAPVKSLI